MTRENGKMDELWAYVGVDRAGKEWLCGVRSPEGGLPEVMVGGDRTSVEKWLPIMRALGVGRDDGHEIRLVRFVQRVDVETVKV